MAEQPKEVRSFLSTRLNEPHRMLDWPQFEISILVLCKIFDWLLTNAENAFLEGSAKVFLSCFRTIQKFWTKTRWPPIRSGYSINLIVSTDSRKFQATSNWRRILARGHMLKMRASKNVQKVRLKIAEKMVFCRFV